MADVRWAKLGVVAMWAAALPLVGCSSSSNECAPGVTADASIMRPGTDGGTNPIPPTDAPASVNGSLGSSCAAAADCQGGLTCVRATDDLRPGEGPSNGLCTRTCVPDSANTTCRPLGGTCVLLDPDSNTGVCAEDCTLGDAPGAKCHNRPDVACESLSNSAGMFVLSACLPLCTDDADCATRKCDLGTGLCSAQPTTGVAPGGACVNDADCQGGICFDVSAVDGGRPAGACFSYCRFGGLEGCGFRRGALTPGGAACAIPQSQDGADGDEGYCLGLCDTDADCAVKTPGWGCVNTADTRRTWGHGLCFFNSGVQTPADAGLPGADASSATDAARDAAREATTVDATAAPDGPLGSAEAGTSADATAE